MLKAIKQKSPFKKDDDANRIKKDYKSNKIASEADVNTGYETTKAVLSDHLTY